MELQCTRLKSVVIQNSHSKSEKQKPPKRTNRHQSKGEYTVSKRRDSSTPSREQTHTWHRSFTPRSSDNIQCYPRKKSYQTLSKSKNSSRGSRHSEEERRSNYPGSSHDYESSPKSTEPSQDSPQKQQVSTKKPSFTESRNREREDFTSYNPPSWRWSHAVDDYTTYQQNFCEYDKNVWHNEYTVPNMEFFLPLDYSQSSNPSISSQTTQEATSCYFPNQTLSLPDEQHYAIREPSDEVFNNGGFYNYDIPYSFLNFRDSKNWIDPPIENKIMPCTSYSNFPVNNFFNPSGFLQDGTAGMTFPSDSVHYMFPQVPQFCDSFFPVRQHLVPSIPKSGKKANKDKSNEFDEALKRIMMEQFSLFTNFTPQFSTWCLECCGWDYGKAADSFIYNSHIVKRIPYMAYNV